MKGYRTIVFNAIMTALVMVRLWNPAAETPDAGDIEAGLNAIDAAITFVWGVGNMLLRAITNTKVFRRE